MKRIGSILATAGLLVASFMFVASVQPAHAISYQYANIAWIRSNLTNFGTGPSRATGYGRVVLTGFPKATCDGCNWYAVRKSITNHQPTLAASERGRPLNLSDAELNGFCWPWSWGGWFGDGCWNILDSWNWPQILSNVNGGWHPWDPRSTIANIVGCIQGVYSGVTFTVVGKPAIGWMLENTDLLRVTTSGTVYAVIGGCTAYFLH